MDLVWRYLDINAVRVDHDTLDGKPILSAKCSRSHRVPSIFIIKEGSLDLAHDDDHATDYHAL